MTGRNYWKGFEGLFAEAFCNFLLLTLMLILMNLFLDVVILLTNLVLDCV